MLKPFALFLLLGAVLFSWFCVQVASLKNVKAIDPQKARAFSDQALDDFVYDRRDALYAKMAKNIFSSQGQLDGLMDQLCDQVGNVTKYEFVSDAGKASLLSKRPTRDMRYMVTTTQEKTYPFTIILVSNDGELAIQEFHFALATLTI